MDHQSGALPSFLIIGAMRSGTSSLARYLRAHPEVCMATQKEVHFFDRNFERGVDWYRSLFPCPNDGQAVGEATQTYMYDQEALERMWRLLPDSRLIAILRNPIDRAYSHYWLNRARGREPLDFGAALEAERERLGTGSLDARFWYSYVDRGRYVRQLKAVCQRYRRDLVHVLLFEDLRDAPAETFSVVCRFLGVEHTVIPPNLGATVNPYVTFRSLRVRRLAGRVPRPIGRGLARLNTKMASYPPMDPAVRSKLAARFEDDTVALEAWLGRDLSAWRT
jgi:hypothetical protein